MAMSTRFSGRAGGCFLTGCLLLLALAADGCSKATGNLSGKISYNGKPLAVGSVLLIGVDAQPRTAWIEADGSYQFTDVPVGEAKLAVYSPDPDLAEKTRSKTKTNPGPKKAKQVRPKPSSWEVSADDRRKWFAIPAKYGDVDQSGLRVTITSGLNNFPIEMK
jgi:hypothetical protein